MAAELDGIDLGDEATLTGTLQENVLTALCSDKTSALLIRRTVEPALFENQIYRHIAEAAVKHIDEFKEPPGEQLSDILEEYRAAATPRRRALIIDTLRKIHATSKGLNSAYVLSRLADFVRERKLKLGVITAMQALQAGRVDDAEIVIRNVLNERIETFDPGLQFWDPAQALRFFDTTDQSLPLNIKALDAARVGPAPQELFTFIAPTGKGKTWFLLHVAKQAVKLRKKTVFVSLEMSEERLSQRFVQAWFSYEKRMPRDATGNSVDHSSVCRFLTDTNNKTGLKTLRGIDRQQLVRPTLDGEKARAALAEYIDERGRRVPLIIKQFPPSSLTMSGLQAYLDSLAQLHHFQPEVLIVDYADLMQHDTTNLRIDLEHTYQQLRGLAIERNLAVVTASQANRLGGNDETKLVTLAHVAESMGKVNVADNVITYTQSLKERRYGLARLFVAKARHDVSHFTVAIAQAYQIGQFCLDDIRMPGKQYWEDAVDEIEDDHDE